MSRIENKVVAITGASSGIGEATALLLAERGAKVVLGARGLDRLKALGDRIPRSRASLSKQRFDPLGIRRRCRIVDDHTEVCSAIDRERRIFKS